MGKKRKISRSIQSRDEIAVFLDDVLQWLCDLQSKDIEIFDEKRVSEIGQRISKKLGVAVFLDPDKNYRKALNLRILIGGNSLSKDNDYFASLKAHQFELRLDISSKGGFYCLHSFAISPSSDGSVLNPVEDEPKPLTKICDRLKPILAEEGLIPIPKALLDRPINGRNELGGVATVMTQLFGEI